MQTAILWMLAALFAAPQKEALQLVSPLGRELYPPPIGEAARTRLEANLDRARQNLERNPSSHENLIWLGRRIAYLGDYKEAIAVYSRALERYPDSPELLRHRGHRYISTRKFDEAIADLGRAARLTRGQRDRVEPDGAPNALNIPTSTLQTNIHYHLGLAHYLKGDFEASLEAYRECLSRSANDDMQVAASHWLYMILRRLGREDDAAEILDPIRPDMDVIENHAYFDLLLMYKGLKAPGELLGDQPTELELATRGYGVGNWHLYSGDEAKAREVFERIVQLDGWSAFGFIAAEAELARMRAR